MKNLILKSLLITVGGILIIVGLVTLIWYSKIAQIACILIGFFGLWRYVHWLIKKH